jgi:hypothetical protein
MKESEPKLYLIDVGACIEEQNLLFNNTAIKSKKIIKPDKYGVFWINKRKILKVNLIIFWKTAAKLKEGEYLYINCRIR